jgi:hypothetical protein
MRDIPQRGRLQLAKRIIIESGLLYTAGTIVFFFSHVCKSAAANVVSAAVSTFDYKLPLACLEFQLKQHRSKFKSQELPLI